MMLRPLSSTLTHLTRSILSNHPTVIVLAGLLIGAIGSVNSVHAEQLITLRNGLTLRGVYIERSTLDENSFSVGADGGIQTPKIWAVDDGLRRTYIHRRGMVNNEPVDIPDLGLHIEFPQPVSEGGDEVGSIGRILGVSPLNEYGRRQLTVRGTDGSPTILHQGLTELTSRYARLEGLKAEKSIRLDMRVATESIDTPSLLRIFKKRMDQTDPNERLEAVRFFMEAERFGDAHRELQVILKQFPEQEELRPQLTALVERQAMQLIEQAQLRRESGQPELAEAILKQFPLGRVGRVTRLRVQDELTEITKLQTQRDETVAQLRKLVSGLPQADQTALTPIVDEIDEHLSANTLNRLSDFIRLGKIETTPARQRVALAIAGWILGSGSGEQNLMLTTSLIEVRDLVQQFLAHPDEGARARILDQLKRLEATRADYIAKLLPLIPPPMASAQAVTIHRSEDAATDDRPFILPIDAFPDEHVQGMYHVGPNQEDFYAAAAADPFAIPDAAYVVQLPPEYDPLREYPCIVALHAAGASAETQLNWWSGVASKQFLAPEESNASADGDAETTQPSVADHVRLGRAAQNGFIVVAPRWTRGGQQSYEYTMREHDAVLRSLRSAMRRFSIDSDRVFIGGHGAGGGAAWDIALSHPDIWSGMIAIGAEPQKTLHHYNANAVYMPVYIVMGDKDGRPLKRNGAVYDDYMTYQHDAMVVMYRGRGKEFFYEESERIFEWMKTSEHRRPRFPESIEVKSMREGDRFFWWLEWQDSLPATVIDPILWDEAERIVAAQVSSTIGANNEIRISQAPSNAFTVWLSPDMPLDFGDQITVRYRNRRSNFQFGGEIDTLLEDARTRADRKRPFWGKVSIP
ncbi:peptidase-like protein [Rhodopirellula sp. SWK7]|nr:peptidase-like protein [Rhodopirellula sp. SWK7]